MFPSVRRAVASSAAAPPAAAVLVLSSHWSASPLMTAASSVAPTQVNQPMPQSRSQHVQRRYSSSKPSSPDNGSGSKAISGVVSSHADSSSSENSSASSANNSNSSSSSFKRKRKAKQDAARLVVQRLPSVPSTQHLPAESIALSNFFSQHRPISITHSLPKMVTDDAFAAIFTTRARRGSKSTDVIRTLSQTIDDLAGGMTDMSLDNGDQAGTMQRGSRARQNKEAQAQFARQQLQQQLQDDMAAANGDSISSPQTQLEFKNADGSDAGIYVQVNSLTGQFLPFQPPPPPVPASTEDESATADAHIADAADGFPSPQTIPGSVITFDLGDGQLTSTGNRVSPFAEDAEPRSTRVFKALLTIEEQMDENGEVRIVAHSPQIVEEGTEAGMESVNGDGVPRSFFERMALRQLRFEDALQRQRDANSKLNGAGLRRHRLPSAYHDGATAVPRMMAISVKRQKKLRMKKKKYKKLMKRTRTLRRKLDRT
ncbi:hypothetical protein SEPCBS119000_000230 [Sporothrix epigloea]|uniref:Small ribosomal subunit protein mS38 n=1 Tax=Sporothrix epigloea TaxID=1892477 RepID=A0ABP0D416_9PEZI